VSNPQSPWKALSLVTVIGMDIVICIMAGVWLGRKADQYFGMAPWGMVAGVMIGIGVGVIIIIPLIKKLLKEQSE
jgi:ATP synthase protein I